MIGLTICLLLAVAQVDAFITVRNHKLYDQQNRERIFHGVNVVMKVPPYLPEQNKFNILNSFTEKDMEYLQSWGMNAIRLGVMWPGVEPKEGQYNQTYLQAMNKLVQTSGNYGIYTLVQFHQDLFSQKFCADGVPVWAIPKSMSRGFPLPISKPFKFDNETGMPRWQDCGKHPWSAYYSTFSVNQGFSALYNNKHKLLQKFQNYWIQVAKTFTQNKYVIAYELINQPWPGNMYNNPLIMIPHLSELFNLQRFYDRVSSSIRKYDRNHPICFQPVTWLNSISAGFSHPPGGKKFANESILCYHYYSPPTMKLEGFMEARVNDIKRLGTGGILSEFFIIGEEGKRNQAMMDQCDKYQQSWLGWIYKPYSGFERDQRTLDANPNSASFFYNDDGTPNPTAIKVIARTYAPIVAGETIRQAYDSNTREFLLTYHICVKCGETVIFANKQYIYPKGYSINISPQDKVTYVIEGNYIKLTPTSSANSGDKILVVLAGF